jgi:5-methylthioadenosine/S-adenosylhomocysteine deaminase
VDLESGAESPESILKEVAGLRQRWQGRAEGRIGVAFGPMAPWRCSDETMRRTVEMARHWGVPIHLHVAEAQDELELLHQRTGLRHVEWLHSLGALGPDVHLVHGVWVNETELDLVASSGSIVVHCPVSNMYLASGIAPVRQMLDRDIPVALGSDGPASHNSQDILETLKVAALVVKVSTGQPTALRSMEALRMVTTSGVRLFGAGEQGPGPTGCLVAGAKADITVINLDTARSMPVHRPESAVVYNASGPDVHTVLVDGQILLDAGQVTVLNEALLLAQCRRAARELLQRAKVELDPVGG